LVVALFVVFTAVPGSIQIITHLWPQRSDEHRIENSVSFSSPPRNDLKETFNTKPTGKTGDITFRVYNPISGKTEEIKPEEGKIYTTKTRKGGRLDYMVEDGKVYTDYTSSDGSIKSYSVSDLQGNMVDQKLPYNIEEYKVVIPPELELRRTERLMPNGWKSVHVDLKWAGKVEMTLDPDNRLKWVHCEGGVTFNHKLKTIVPGLRDTAAK
jgi:hypothetical protein